MAIMLKRSETQDKWEKCLALAQKNTRDTIQVLVRSGFSREEILESEPYKVMIDSVINIYSIGIFPTIIVDDADVGAFKLVPGYHVVPRSKTLVGVCL